MTAAERSRSRGRRRTTPSRGSGQRGLIALDGVRGPPARAIERGTGIGARRLADRRPHSGGARRIEQRLEARERDSVLLYGVTGSGKTEVYLRASPRSSWSSGRGAIVLVPEIALTPQTAGRVQRRASATAWPCCTPRSVPGERAAEWRRLRSGEARVVRRAALGGVRAGAPTSAWS